MTLEQTIKSVESRLAVAKTNLFRTSKRTENGIKYNPYPEHPGGLPTYQKTVNELTLLLQKLKTELAQKPVIPNNETFGPPVAPPPIKTTPELFTTMGLIPGESSIPSIKDTPGESSIPSIKDTPGQVNQFPIMPVAAGVGLLILAGVLLSKRKKR